MSQWIRWKGLLPFVLICTGLVLFSLLFLDTLVKGLIEDSATDMLGAKVESRQLELHLSPLGITIEGLQFTNPDEPMSNAVEIGRVRFGLETDKLLLGKVIIEQMELEQVRFDTPRSHSGAVARPAPEKAQPEPAPAEQAPATELPSLSLPDIDAILAREPLQAPQQAEAVKASIQQLEQQWSKLQATLPDAKRQQAYAQRAAAIAKTRQDDPAQILAAIKQLQGLQADLQHDLGTINSSRQDVQGRLGRLEQDYQALLKAPQADRQRLLQKYSPDAKGVGQLSQLMFGAQAGGYVQQGLAWYQRLLPLLGDDSEQPPEPTRQAGQELRFREFQPSPDFLIRRIHATVETKQGNFEGVVLDLTHQPEVLKRPMSFEFKGQQMSGMQALHIHGGMNHIHPQQRSETLEMEIRGYQVARYSLSEDPNLQLVMKSARSDTQLQLRRLNGRLDGRMDIHLQGIDYDNRAGSGDFQQVLVEAMNKVRDFHINTRITGTLGQPGLALSSDLDRRLNQQISSAFERRIRDYQQQLSQRIQQQAEAQIAPVRASIDALRGDIDARLKAAEAPLKAAEQQLHRQQAGLEAQQRRLQQQLQDAANQLLRQLPR